MLTLLPSNCLTVFEGQVLFDGRFITRLNSLSLSVKAQSSLSSFHLEPFSSLIPLPCMSYTWKWFAVLLHLSLAFILFNLLKIHFCHLPQRRPRPNLLLRLLSVMLSDFMFLQLQAQLGFNLDWSLWIGHHRTHTAHNK